MLVLALPFLACSLPDSGSSGGADAGSSASTGVIRVCVVTENGSPTGVVDPANCTQLADSPPRLPTVDVGFAEPDAQAPGAALRIFNDGRGPLYVTAVTVGDPHFEVMGFQPVHVLPGESTDASLAFSPSADGTLTTTTVVSSDDPAHPTVTLPLTGAAGGFTPQSCLDPSALVFGDVAVGQSKTLTLAVENCGQVSEELTSLTPRGDASTSDDFAVGSIPVLPHRLRPGDVLDVDVTFQPHASGDFGGNLDLTIAGQSRTVSMSGSGTS